MDEEALARVFEPYFSTKATGTGLGLPIARRNIELSGGSIEVESEKGAGTAVTMRLPMTPNPDAGASDAIQACDGFRGDRGSAVPVPAIERADRPRLIDGPDDVGVGHHDQREARVGGDQRDDDGADEQREVRAAPADVDRLDAAEADRADHQERGHEDDGERRQRAARGSCSPTG